MSTERRLPERASAVLDALAPDKGAGMDELTYLYAPIVVKRKNDDGSLVVSGTVADSSIDLDQQVCDPGWLKTALPDWFEWGNIREQHGQIAAGVAKTLEHDEATGGWTVDAKIVEPTSCRKIEEGVLKGFSIGIRRPVIVRDKAAAGGRIAGGKIIEVSVVDRPANPNCRLTLAKAAGPDGEGELEKVEEVAEPAAEIDGQPAKAPEAPEPAPGGAVAPAEATEPAGEGEGASAPEAAADGSEKAEKAGRVQAGRNLKRLKAIMAAVAEMLAEAEPEDDGAEELPADEEKSRLATDGEGGGGAGGKPGTRLAPPQKIRRGDKPAPGGKKPLEKDHEPGHKALTLADALKRLGAPEWAPETLALLPELNKALNPDQEPTMRVVLRGLMSLIAQEAREAATGEDEEECLRVLLDCYRCFKYFWRLEEQEGEVGPMRSTQSSELVITEPFRGSDPPLPGGVGQPVASALAARTSTEPAKADLAKEDDMSFPDDLLDELSKMLLADVQKVEKNDPDPPEPDGDGDPSEETAAIKAAVQEAIAPIVESVSGLQGRLEAIEKAPRPGGPARVATGVPPGEGATAADQAALRQRIAHYERLEKTVSDRRLAAGYADLAKGARDELDKVLAPAS